MTSLRSRKQSGTLFAHYQKIFVNDLTFMIWWKRSNRSSCISSMCTMNKISSRSSNIWTINVLWNIFLTFKVRIQILPLLKLILFTVYFIDISTHVCRPKKYIFSWEEKKISHTNSIFIIPPLKVNANFSCIIYYLVDKIAKFDKYLWIFSAFLDIW